MIRAKHVPLALKRGLAARFAGSQGASQSAKPLAPTSGGGAGVGSLLGGAVLLSAGALGALRLRPELVDSVPSDLRNVLLRFGVVEAPMKARPDAVADKPSPKTHISAGAPATSKSPNTTVNGETQTDTAAPDKDTESGAEVGPELVSGQTAGTSVPPADESSEVPVKGDAGPPETQPQPSKTTNHLRPDGEIRDDSGLPEDFGALDVATLRTKLESLLRELDETVRFEAIRQHDLWRRSESSLERKFSSLRQLERHHLESRFDMEVSTLKTSLDRALELSEGDMRDKLHAREKEVDNALEQRVDQYYAAVQEAERWKVGTEFIRAHADRTLVYASDLRDQIGSRTAACEKSHAEFQDVAKAIERTRDEETESMRTAASNASLLVDALAAQDQSEPNRLKNFYRKVHQAALSSTLAPEGLPGAAGQLVGNILATLSIPNAIPSYAATCTPLIRANEAVARGDFKGAVEELNKLDGAARRVVKDWTEDAVNYLQKQSDLDSRIADVAGRSRE